MAPDIKWNEIGFQYTQTDSYILCEYKNGKWGDIQVRKDPYIPLHVAATCLHYGQSCFEGLKAFRQADGSVASFRPRENAKRIINTAERLVMEAPPEALFMQAVHEVIRNNLDWIPPYGTGASFYIRPLLIGASAHVGIHPSEDYTFIMLGMPVGPYYKNGFFPVKAFIQEKYDRAAPRGIGNVKAAANYAAGLMGDIDGKSKGFPICLYLDSAVHEYIDEFSTSNFFALTQTNEFVTPQSSSILPSITNKSIQEIARDFGLVVQNRPVHVSELANLKEVGACGTAAIVTPVYSITRGETVYTFGKQDEAGEFLTRFYKEITAIQFGEKSDRHNWMEKTV